MGSESIGVEYGPRNPCQFIPSFLPVTRSLHISAAVESNQIPLHLRQRFTWFGNKQPKQSHSITYSTEKGLFGAEPSSNHKNLNHREEEERGYLDDVDRRHTVVRLHHGYE